MGTCIGATFKVSGGLADVTPTNGARLGLGFTDGVSNRCVSFVSGNVSVLTVTRRIKSIAYCAMLVDVGGTVNGSAAFDSFITDGIRLNVDNAWANSFFVEARLYFDEGNDECFVGTGDTSAGDHVITAVPFLASFLEGISTVQSSVGAAQTGAKFLMGLANNEGIFGQTQNAFSYFEAHNVTDGAPSARVDSQYFLRDIENASVLGAVEISNFDSSGFTANQVNGAGFEFYYMAVKCDNETTLDLVQSRDSVMTHEHGAPGFRPQTVFGWNSKINTLSTNFQDGRAGAFGLWQSTGPSSQYNSSVAVEDLSAVTDTQSDNDNSFPYLPDHDGGLTTAIIGTITQFTSLGFEIQYTNVDSVKCYFSVLAIKPITKTLLPTGITSNEAFGTDIVTPSGPTLLPPGTASGEAFGVHVVAPGGVTILPAAIASGEAFGAAFLLAVYDLLPLAIATAEEFGVPVIVTNSTQFVSPSSIASDEEFGGDLVVIAEGEGHLDLEEVKRKWRERRRFARPPRSIIFFLPPVSFIQDDPFGEPSTVLPAAPFIKK